MERSIALTIAYDGASYAGWQWQANANTVQAEVERALAAMTKSSVRVVGASRTDAGVHALGQVTVFRTTTAIPTAAFVPGLNALLPGDISVLAARDVSPDFDPRRAARSKHYRYLIHTAPTAYALLHLKVWHRWGTLDLPAMQEAAQGFVGEHDFSAVCASDDENHSRVRTVLSCRVTGVEPSELWPLYANCCGAMVVIDCVGNGFLKYMIRTMVGTLAEVGEGKRTAGSIAALLAERDRTRAGPCVPATGLYLCGIEYDNSQ